jgi:hypothetical protein
MKQKLKKSDLYNRIIKMRDEINKLPINWDLKHVIFRCKLEGYFEACVDLKLITPEEQKDEINYWGVN